MRKRSSVATLAVIALLVAGCGRSGSTGASRGEDDAAQTTSGARPAGDFGDLKGLCGPGDASGSPAQGVTSDTIKAGVLSDVGFTKKSEYGDAAKVFTSWCNDAGGVGGRKLEATVRDTRMMEVRQRVIEACKEDFALVGGGAALDGLGVKERLECTLPDFPAQTSMINANGSDLQVNQTGGTVYNRYSGYYPWLVQEAYPESAKGIGVIAGDSGTVKVMSAQSTEAMEALGAKVVYHDLYPAAGVSDWTPYAQSLKKNNVRGLIWYGDFTQLAKLEQALTAMNYKLDWIDTNNNAYGPAFIKLGGKALDFQNNLTDLSGVHPLEQAADNPATQQVIDLFEKYAPDADITMPALRAFSAWALFVKSAKACGDQLTRRCVYDNARKEKAWTGGGVLAPVDLSGAEVPLDCFNIEHATSKGWEPADFKPDNSAFRCGVKQYKFKGKYGRAMTLADVGKTMNDVK
ncbi:ABC transporter substrate-binding protein [Streptomyces sp. NPDC002896]|uniref:ABC transporter substrate-binding protein n=1 Tax=Streptomyces sp. NPDC002896 TaxID=3154438 RepID=UPI00331D19F3